MIDLLNNKKCLICHNAFHALRYNNVIKFNDFEISHGYGIICSKTNICFNFSSENIKFTFDIYISGSSNNENIIIDFERHIKYLTSQNLFSIEYQNNFNRIEDFYYFVIKNIYKYLDNLIFE